MNTKIRNLIGSRFLVVSGDKAMKEKLDALSDEDLLNCW